MKKRGEKHFVLCARDKDHKALFEIGRICLVIPDNGCAQLSLTRSNT